MIDVAFCIDAGFWEPLLITVSSLLFHNQSSTFRLFVCTSSYVSAERHNQLAEIVDAAGNATVSTMAYGDLAHYSHLPIHGHLSLATYLRLFLTELLPRDVEKVIYLDSDVLIRSNRMNELWSTEIGDAYLGAAFEPFDAQQRTPLNFGPDDFYFNAGVMLLNLRKWRDDNVLPKFLEFAEEHLAVLYSPDQDILNSVFRGRVLDIGLRWNWQALFPRLQPAQLHITAAEFKHLRRSADIVHFTSRYKPWSWKWAPHYQSEYVKVLNRSPWRENRPDKGMRNLPVKLKRMSQRLLEWYLPGFARLLRGLRPAAKR